MEHVKEFRIAEKIITIVLLINFALLGVKIYLFMLTASLAVFAFVVDTLMDMLADTIGIFATKRASKPADEDHTYGHAKYDSFVSVIIAMLIIFGAIEIFANEIERIISKQAEISLPSSAIGLFLALGTIYLAISIAEYVYSKKLNISVLEASALHYISDPLYTAAVFLGVYFASIGYIFADYLVSTAIAIILLAEAIGIIRKHGSILLDATAVNPEMIRNWILKNFPEVNDVHEIKSRTDGISIFLEFHLVLDGNLSLQKAHDICHKVEKFLLKKLRRSIGNITIHAEPYYPPHED